MKIYGNPVGGVGGGSQTVHIGDTQPAGTNVLWFNTAAAGNPGGGGEEGAAMLNLTREITEDTAVIVETGGVNYAASNIVDDTSTPQPYDYTII